MGVASQMDSDFTTERVVTRRVFSIPEALSPYTLCGLVSLFVEKRASPAAPTVGGAGGATPAISENALAELMHTNPGRLVELAESPSLDDVDRALVAEHLGRIPSTPAAQPTLERLAHSVSAIVREGAARGFDRLAPASRSARAFLRRWIKTETSPAVLAVLRDALLFDDDE